MRYSLKNLFLSAVFAVSSNTTQAQYPFGLDNHTNWVFDRIQTRLIDLKSNKTEKPLLSVLAVEKNDTPARVFGFEAVEQEPAVQGLYAAISHIIAAQNVMGKENVILAIGLDQRTIDGCLQKISNDVLDEKDKASPFPHILKFAVHHQLKIVPVDPLSRHPRYQVSDCTSAPRYEGMLESLRDIGRKNPDSLVVAIVAEDAMPWLHGMSPEDIVKGFPVRNPLEQHFSIADYTVAAGLGQFELDHLQNCIEISQSRIAREGGSLTIEEIHGQFRLRYHEYLARKENDFCVYLETPLFAQEFSGEEIVELVVKSAEGHEDRKAGSRQENYFIFSQDVK